ncbi:IS66 family transposase [Streptomyces sp. NPDC000851]
MRESGGPPPPAGTKKTFARQVADRVERRRADILRFLHDLAVPFTNNQGEQDIRMVKVQTKTSGGRRTLDGANRRLLVCSYLSTARKHGQNSLAVLPNGRRLSAAAACFYPRPPAPSSPESSEHDQALPVRPN